MFVSLSDEESHAHSGLQDQLRDIHGVLSCQPRAQRPFVALQVPDTLGANFGSSVWLPQVSRLSAPSSVHHAPLSFVAARPDFRVLPSTLWNEKVRAGYVVHVRQQEESAGQPQSTHVIHNL